MTTISAVKCKVCGMLHESDSATYALIMEDGTQNCYCVGCTSKRGAAENKQITKKTLLCG